MIERTPAFLAAQDRVKVGHFTRQGFDIGGVVHVGANDGEEIPYYLELGAPRVIAFEPEWKALGRLYEKFSNDNRVEIFPCALGDQREMRHLRVTRGDGKGSSFLKEKASPYEVIDIRPLIIHRFATLPIDISDCSTLVVDVQGMELEVLKGFGEKIHQFKFLNIECSEVPLFEGEAPAAEMVEWLSLKGFNQDSPIVSHDDIMFIRRGLK